MSVIKKVTRQQAFKMGQQACRKGETVDNGCGVQVVVNPFAEHLKYNSPTWLYDAKADWDQGFDEEAMKGCEF